MIIAASNPPSTNYSLPTIDSTHMRIGIDCRKILNPEAGEVGGVAHYTHYLVRELLTIDHDNEYVLFFDNRIANTKPYEKKNVTIRAFPFYQYKRYLPIAYSHMLISAFITREKLDVYHAPATILPYLYAGRSVITVHDLAIYEHPDWFPSKYLSRQQFSTRMLVPQSVRAAKEIIAISEHTKHDIKKHFHVHDERIHVIPLGVAPESVDDDAIRKTRAHFRLPAQYALFLGTIEPRKNIEGLIAAFRAAFSKFKTIQTLVIAGGRGWKNESIFTAVAIANKALEPWQGGHPPVRFLGPVSHEHKLALISGATAFVWPSFYEGFGLPVLEAMALGTPVLTSNTTSLPEVAGDAALLVNPRDERAIAEALIRLDREDELRQSLVEKGRVRAQQFSWRTTAEKTLEVYRMAISGD